MSYHFHSMMRYRVLPTTRRRDFRPQLLVPSDPAIAVFDVTGTGTEAEQLHDVKRRTNEVTDL